VTRAERYDSVLEQWIRRVQWELFAHLTARRLLSESKAQALLRAWVREVNRRAFGRNYFRRSEGVYGAAVVAPQSRGDLHIHAVLANTNDLDPSEAKRLWDRRDGAGRVQCLAQVDRYDRERGGAAYLARHLGEAGDRAALEVIGRWPR